MWPTRSDLDDDLVQEMEDFLVEHGNRYLNETVIEGIPMSSLFQVGFKLSHCCYVHLRGMVHGSLCQGSTALICGRVCVELLVVLRDPLGDSHYHWIEFGFERHTALQDLSGSLDRTGRGFLLAPEPTGLVSSPCLRDTAYDPAQNLEVFPSRKLSMNKAPPDLKYEDGHSGDGGFLCIDMHQQFNH